MTRLSLVAVAAVIALSAAGAPQAMARQPAPAAAAATDAYPLPAVDGRPLQYGRVTVEVVGRGPDVILIPGLNSSRDTWKELVATEKGHYRFHLIQVAGFAGTPAGDNAAGEVFSPVVEAIAQYIHDRRLKAPAVIGHSMGGELALALAARHPDAVGRVMVVDSLPWFGVLFGQSEVNERLRGMTKGMVAQMSASDGEGWKQGSIRNTAPLLGEGPMKPVVIGWSLGSDRRVSAQAFGDLVLTDLRPELAAIKVPVTVLYAHGPQFGAQKPEQTDAFVGALYKTLKGARLVRIEPSHHFIMFDQPARFQSEVEAFLK
jgi:pimeloyl-ACP methyl ester carboxylesterase